MRIAALALLLIACEGRDQPHASATPSGPAADCTLVAEVLTSFELGNYASIEERRPKIAEWRAKCEAQKLTKEEGDCILDAKRERDLVYCPRSLMFPPYKLTAEGEVISGLPPECSKYLIGLERYTRCHGLPAEARASIASTVAQMRRNWSMFSEQTPMPPAVAAACKQGNDAIRQAMVTFSCD
ncbi:MAG: hypothetical protein H0T46_21100 [Deltaproteobacteria bacterium]|nr:hypothetical protein [Deltaproteobacteria bacterium]